MKDEGMKPISSALHLFISLSLHLSVTGMATWRCEFGPVDARRDRDFCNGASPF
jgi:hypothetical protein